MKLNNEAYIDDRKRWDNEQFMQINIKCFKNMIKKRNKAE
jgi:hypothetical protein